MKLAALISLMISLSAMAEAITGSDGRTPPEDWLVRAAQVMPHPRQLVWQQLEFGGMIHFGMNTFTDRPWGDGKEDPHWFNPTDLDAREWVRTFKAAGMRLVVLTAKHHDGFCLWPSKFTEHSVKNSPWRDGKGDLVRDVADACRAEGLKFGVYLSPADLHEPSFGTPAYVEHFSNQLRELLTSYGEITEVWFDDANPSSKPTQYNFLAWKRLVRELQPNAVIFGRGSDVRWIGNEGGVPRVSEWSVIPIPVPSEQFTGGNMMGEDLGSRAKIRNARHLLWWPAEAAVSIRPEWFYHPVENDKVRTVDQLFSDYLCLVGGNSFFMLNVPPNRLGELHPVDAANLRRLGERIRSTFALDLARGSHITASSTKAGDSRIDPLGLLDGDPDTYWSAAKGVSKAEIIVEFKAPAFVSLIDFGEHIATGQRIEQFAVEVDKNRHWQQVCAGKTVGYRRIVKLHEPTLTTRIRLRIMESRLDPALDWLRVY